MNLKQYIKEQKECHITTEEQPGKYIVWLLCDTQKIGRLTIQTNFDDKHNWLTGFYIKPLYRHKGYARQMFEAAKQKATKDIILKIYPYEDESKNIEQLREMYKKFGFVELKNTRLKDYMIYRI